MEKNELPKLLATAVGSLVRDVSFFVDNPFAEEGMVQLLRVVATLRDNGGFTSTNLCDCNEEDLLEVTNLICDTCDFDPENWDALQRENFFKFVEYVVKATANLGAAVTYLMEV